MFNNKTDYTINQDALITEYDTFMAVNMESGDEALYLLVAHPENDAFYQAVHSDGGFGTFWIRDCECFDDRFGEDYLIYAVDRDAVKFNSIDYKYR